jgi:hypothetical protein
MKQALLLCLLSTLLLSNSECSNKKSTEVKYKGRLEVAGICMNYTIGLLEGNINTNLIEADWTDDSNGKKYTKVFALGNPCRFPKNIKQGDEFYFTIDTTVQQPCNVCEAFYPTPAKALSISVVEK